MVYYSKKYRKEKAKKKPKLKTNWKPKTPNDSNRITTPAGCIIKPTKKGRCSKYLTCQHQRECLMAIPLGWQGFTAVDEKGYKEKKRELDLTSQGTEYWGYHQAIATF